MTMAITFPLQSDAGSRTLTILHDEKSCSRSRARHRILGRFPFVRTDRPGHSLRNENSTFNQSYPARSVKS